jgi:SAM-dependent methyltransferase
MNFVNSWGNKTRADSYSKLEFPNTYYLAYRDLPDIIGRHVQGGRAVDFGCGAGRSTRFLKKLGFSAIGLDISRDMLAKAKELDPAGDYRLVSDGRYDFLGKGRYDLVQSIFTFDNIPGWEARVKILKSLASLLKPIGKILCLDSNSEMYVREWASFSTKDFPENADAETGDVVKVSMTDVADRRPVEDILWTEDDYKKMFESAGHELEATYKPLGRDDEPFQWVNEKDTPPWIIFVLRKKRE